MSQQITRSREHVSGLPRYLDEFKAQEADEGASYILLQPPGTYFQILSQVKSRCLSNL